MDKVTKYQVIIKEILVTYADYYNGSKNPIKTQIIFDEERHHYLLMSVGWEGRNMIYGTSFHIDIKEDGKVWVQQDNTDAVIVDELLRKGIPKSEIVLGFHPPFIRPHTEFAAS